jgi:hypothetical protein
MAYSKGTSNNIIVGAASLFTFEEGLLTDADLPTAIAANSYVSALSIGATAENNNTGTEGFRNVGYTSNGLELMFEPDFGEVTVDQILDTAKLYKQGMKVNMKTSFAEATLENLLLATAAAEADLGTKTTGGIGSEKTLVLKAGELGECPIERGLVAVGPGTGNCAPTEQIERIYVAYRALSIESVTVAAKREEATMFEVSFRLLPNDSGVYGKIVDRTYTADSTPRS